MDLPVGLTGDVDVVKGASVVFRISSTQKQLATRLRIWIPEVETGRFFLKKKKQKAKHPLFKSLN